LLKVILDVVNARVEPEWSLDRHFSEILSKYSRIPRHPQKCKNLLGVLVGNLQNIIQNTFIVDIK